jgi:hypothetical protein
MVPSSDFLFSPSRKCPIRILIVADGILHFGPASNGFGLSELVQNIQQSARPWEDIVITTALRGDDGDNCTPNINFLFEKGKFDTDHFDQVWLFGHINDEDPTLYLGPSELRVLYDFMNDGGGVFASGDHEGLGYGLCGEIPRVRSMRKWQYSSASRTELKAPGRDDATRLDTLRAGFDPGFQITDQSDPMPQEIRPKYFANLGGIGSHPHPLLADREFAVTVLPDHMHEGECVIPMDLSKSFDFDGGEGFYEYPFLPNGIDRLSPEMVAISTSAGGYLRGDKVPNVPPVEPRCFMSIVAYDGHLVEVQRAGVKVKLGRVAVDSSFHHFLDINLKGTGSNPPKRGLYDLGGNPTKSYRSIKRYYRNIVTWLMPPRRVFQYYVSMLTDLRFSSDLIEEFPVRPSFELSEITNAGALTQNAITRRYSQCEATACSLALMRELPPKFSIDLERVFNPWVPSASQSFLSKMLINSQFFLTSILGIAMLGIAANLPMDVFEANSTLDRTENHLKLFSAFMGQMAEQKLTSILEVINQSLAALSEL